MPNQFRTRLLLSFGSGFVLWVAIMTVLFLRGLGAEQFSAQSEALRLSSQMAASMLSELIKERSVEIDLLRRSPLFVEGDLNGAGVRQALELRRASQDQYLWLGVADTEGIVAQATGGILNGESVKARPWFEGAQKGPYTGDVHKALLLEKRLPKAFNNEPLRFIDFASPILGKDGKLKGILAAHASWAMVSQSVQLKILPALGHEFAEMLIINEQGQVIYPQKWADSLKTPAFAVNDARAKELVWPDGSTWLTTVATVNNTTPTQLNWRVVIREPISMVVLRLQEFQIKRIVLTLVSSLMLLLVFYGIATVHSRPLSRLTRLASSVRAQWAEPADSPGAHPATGSGFDQVARVLSELDGILAKQSAHSEEIESKITAGIQSQSAVLIQSNVNLTEQVTRDALTGLLNRREFDARLEDAVRRARHGPQSAAVLFLDLDHFKHVNDNFGHDVGDAVLKKFGQVLLENSRTSDVVARYGGEEFVILLPDTNDSQVASKVAEKLRQAVDATDFPTVGHLSVSIGVALTAAQDSTGAAVLKRADNALYQAKTTGRNKVACADLPGASETQA